MRLLALGFRPLLLCPCLLMCSQMVSAADDRLIVAHVGEHQIVFPPGYHGLNYFPDEPISVLRRTPFLVVAGNSTFLVQGATANSAIPIGQVLGLGAKNEFDNGHAGITSTYYDRKTKRFVVAQVVARLVAEINYTEFVRTVHFDFGADPAFLLWVSQAGCRSVE